MAESTLKQSARGLVDEAVDRGLRPFVVAHVPVVVGREVCHIDVVGSLTVVDGVDDGANEKRLAVDARELASALLELREEATAYTENEAHVLAVMYHLAEMSV